MSYIFLFLVARQRLLLTFTGEITKEYTLKGKNEMQEGIVGQDKDVCLYK